MDTMIEYVKQMGKYSLEEKPLNEIDSVIFAQLAYFDYSDLPNEFETTFSDLNDLEQIYRMAQTTTYDFQGNIALMVLVKESRRFGSVKFGFFYELFDVEIEKQFAAITYQLAKNQYYIAYRGTDETFIGWKEDFYLTFSEVIPAQIDAFHYLLACMSRLRGDFYVGGHSKGGNLAEYAILNLPFTHQEERVLGVYNFDGPGIKNVDDYHLEYHRFRHRIHKYVPQTSLIGMLLDTKNEFTVVRSQAFGGMSQHNPFTWGISDNHFIRKDNIDRLSTHTQTILHNWIQGMDNLNRKRLVDLVFTILFETSAETMKELESIDLVLLKDIIKVAKKMDNDSRVFLQHTLKQLHSISYQETMTLLELRVAHWREKRPVLPMSRRK